MCCLQLNVVQQIPERVETVGLLAIRKSQDIEEDISAYLDQKRHPYELHTIVEASTQTH